jgi:MFS family permease
MTGLRFLAPYRSLLTTRSTRAFVAAGLVGRFPLSMLGLGAVLLVSAATGSYTLAGAVSATLALSSGGSGPLLGSVADRRGQRPVLLACLVAHLAGVTGLVGAAVLDAPAWTLFPPAVLAGAGTPPVGSFVRTRWTALVGGTPRLNTALSLESVIDEVVFVVGPVLATSLSALLWPGAGLAAASALATVGCLWLAAQRATAPAPVAQPTGRGGSAMRVPAMRAVALVFVVVGAAFGAVDVSTVAFAKEHGVPVAAGLLLAALAGGSLVAGLLYGTVHWVRPLHQRFLLGLAGFAVAFVPVAAVPTVPLMAVAAAVAGLSVAPTLVPGIGLVEARVPVAARTEGFAWIGTAIAAGVAAGAYLAGRAVDAAGAHRAFLVVAAAACLALLVGLAAARPLAAARAADTVDAATEAGQ